MKFTEIRFKSQVTGNYTSGWVPNITYKFPTSRSNDLYADIEIAGRKRVVSSHVLRLAMTFNKEILERMARGHDCAVFALACESREPHLNTIFNRPGGKKVAFTEARRLTEPTVEPEEIVLTSSAKGSEHYISEFPHIVVRANVDDKEPLFAGKFGTDGPVMFSGFRAVQKLYPVEAVWAISGLRAVNPGEENFPQPAQ